MRIVYSYIRLTLGCWMFLSGVTIQFIPSPAAAERDARQRERLLKAVPFEEQTEWLRQRDKDDSESEAYLRLFGVLLGGFGLAMALFETACVSARASRLSPIDFP